MSPIHERFTVSQVAVWIRDEKILLLEDSDRSGCWLLPGGRIDVGEDPKLGFHRELKEEIDLEDFEIGLLVDAEVWFSKDGTPVCSIARLIVSDHDAIKISHEHSEARWVSEDELGSLNFIWPHGERVCRKGFEMARTLHV